jgi:hypothetical protein
MIGSSANRFHVIGSSIFAGRLAVSASFVLAAVLLVPSESGARGAPPVERPHARGLRDDFRDFVKPFMSALRSGDVKPLRSLTSMPFTFDTTAVRKNCTGVFKTTDEISAWLKCVRQAEDRMFSRMEAGADLLERGDGCREPPPLYNVAAHVATSGRWVQAYLQAYLPRMRTTDTFCFLIVEDGLRGEATLGAFLISHDRP